MVASSKHTLANCLPKHYIRQSSIQPRSRNVTENSKDTLADEKEKLKLKFVAAEILRDKGTEKTNRSMRAVAASFLEE